MRNYKRRKKIILVIFIYFNNSREVKKEGFYSISFFYSDNKEKIFEVEDIEIDYFKNIIQSMVLIK